MTLYTNEDFRPGTIQDVVIELVPASDPDGYLYSPDRKWVLVKTQGALERASYLTWDDKTVAVISYKIASSCPWILGWRTTGATVMYVRAQDVEGISEGDVHGDARFLLHDLVDHRLASRA